LNTEARSTLQGSIDKREGVRSMYRVGKAGKNIFIIPPFARANNNARELL
jgi:hypothetical protein